jgi:uncharacterized protein (TIGR01777 family)
MTNPVLNSREGWTRTTIAITGSSGLIGSALIPVLERYGHEIRTLVRRPARTPLEISWDPDHGSIDAARLEGVDAVVHLAGETLGQRWTDDVKRRARDSRVKSTTLLARTLASLATKPSVLLSGSAIGIYGNRGDESLDEASALGDDFLASICKEWEAAASPAADAGIRVVNLRTGLVLSSRGGALEKMLIPFRMGVGGPMGNGRQWMSWISMSDYVRTIGFLIRADTLAGPVNLVAPNPVTNTEFTHALGHVLSRPALVTVPKFALRLAMGEMVDATILASQRVRPRRLLEGGFDFKFPTVESALRAELA